MFVFAVTQLSHYLLAHHTLAGALQTLVMFLAVWWAWMYTAWATNWLDPERAPVRLVLIGVMLLSMVMSSSIPAAFGNYGWLFASAYVAIQVGRTAYTAWAREDFPGGRSTNMARATLYFIIAGLLWIAGGLDPDPTRRLLWWLAALAIEYAGPFTFFYVPGVGRSTLAEWNISGTHMAERCGLFIIIALGEGIIVTGATFAELQPSIPAVVAFLSAFLASVAMWWIYFDVGARRGSELIEHDRRPGLMGRQAYTYGHIPIVAGIIVLAVADEQVLIHPTGHLEPFFIAALVGGAILFISGTWPVQADDQQPAPVAAVPSCRPRSVRPAWGMGGSCPPPAPPASPGRDRAVHRHRRLGMGLVSRRLAEALGALEGLADQVEGTEEGLDQGNPFKLGIEPTIILASRSLEPLERFERFPMIGGHIDSVAIAPQLGPDEAGSSGEQPRPIAAGAIGAHELLLLLRSNFKLPEPKMGHANARATFRVCQASITWPSFRSWLRSPPLRSG